ncbi:hypothetical protein EVAR_69417_1 [Eumeta japonica]|uniref:Uncharacterized protein n=1 Tax=Eumeta variegata TaxID=151549 RepID=A0A4C1Z7N0_EUMVA|nr:hypothetical protein EVAR_69417_1 [Eumeta japonica]
MVLRAAKWRWHARFKCIKRITLVVAAPPFHSICQIGSRSVKQFYFSPSSRQNGRVSSRGRSILPAKRYIGGWRDTPFAGKMPSVHEVITSTRQELNATSLADLMMELEGGHRNSVIKRRDHIEFRLVFNDAKEETKKEGSGGGTNNGISLCHYGSTFQAFLQQTSIRHNARKQRPLDQYK